MLRRWAHHRIFQTDRTPASLLPFIRPPRCFPLKIESIAPPLKASCVMRAGARVGFGRLRKTLLVTTALIGCSAFPAAAQDATWASNPGSNVYGTASNWTPAAVPTGTASFGASNVNTILLLTDVTIGGWTFNAGAPAYTFRVGGNLDFTGAGIVDNGAEALSSVMKAVRLLSTMPAPPATPPSTSSSSRRRRQVRRRQYRRQCHHHQ